MKSNRKDQDNLIIPVKIRGDIIEIQWNQTLETWELCDEHIKIPKTGNFKIGKGIDKNYNRNTRHELNKLNRMKYCIDSLKENSNFSGGKTLVDLVNPQLNHTPKLNDNSKSQNTTNELTSFKNILNKYEMMTFFNRFDDQQKKVIEEIFDQNVVILNGEGGSGKTEIAAFIALFYILLEKRVLISTETRNALDNILFRISKISKTIQNSTLFTNIIRLENHSPSYEIDTLEQWGMSKEVQKITKQIIGKTQNIQENNKESNKENSRENNRENNKANNEKNHLKTSFRNIFTKPRKLERMIAQSYNIILSNYGLICERDYFNDPFQKFDLNIIEASSSSNFSAISTSILNSEKWLFLNDNAQITPLTVGDYLLKQQLRFPNENELDSAVKFDPSDLNLSKTKKIWSNREYGKGVVSLFTQFKTNDNIVFLNLKNQYRINPVLYAALSQAYGKYQSTYPSKKSYRNLSTLSELLNTRSHLKYEIMSQEEILDNMGKRVADLIDSIESSKKNATHLTIGIACTDVISLRKMLNVYRNIKTRGNSLRKNATNHYSEHRNNLNITFCSIKSHQEREYDIFILGILRYGSKNFKYRLYTALSRSSNYTIIFGPSIKSYKKIANNPLQKNKEILNQLEKASHD